MSCIDWVQNCLWELNVQQGYTTFSKRCSFKDFVLFLWLRLLAFPNCLCTFKVWIVDRLDRWTDTQMEKHVVDEQLRNKWHQSYTCRGYSCFETDIGWRSAVFCVGIAVLRRRWSGVSGRSGKSGKSGRSGCRKRKGPECGQVARKAFKSFALAAASATLGKLYGPGEQKAFLRAAGEDVRACRNLLAFSSQKRCECNPDLDTASLETVEASELHTKRHGRRPQEHIW